MQIYIQYGEKDGDFLSYTAPVVPRVGEEIEYEEPNGSSIIYFLVEKVSHYTDGSHYEVNLKCQAIRKNRR